MWLNILRDDSTKQQVTSIYSFLSWSGSSHTSQSVHISLHWGKLDHSVRQVWWSILGFHYNPFPFPPGHKVRLHIPASLAVRCTLSSVRDCATLRPNPWKTPMWSSIVALCLSSLWMLSAHRRAPGPKAPGRVSRETGFTCLNGHEEGCLLNGNVCNRHFLSKIFLLYEQDFMSNLNSTALSHCDSRFICYGS